MAFVAVVVIYGHVKSAWSKDKRTSVFVFPRLLENKWLKNCHTIPLKTWKFILNSFGHCSKWVKRRSRTTFVDFRNQFVLEFTDNNTFRTGFVHLLIFSSIRFFWFIVGRVWTAEWEVLPSRAWSIPLVVQLVLRIFITKKAVNPWIWKFEFLNFFNFNKFFYVGFLHLQVKNCKTKFSFKNHGFWVLNIFGKFSNRNIFEIIFAWSICFNFCC